MTPLAHYHMKKKNTRKTAPRVGSPNASTASEPLIHNLNAYAIIDPSYIRANICAEARYELAAAEIQVFLSDRDVSLRGARARGPAVSLSLVPARQPLTSTTLSTHVYSQSQWQGYECETTQSHKRPDDRQKRCAPLHGPHHSPQGWTWLHCRTTIIDKLHQ